MNNENTETKQNFSWLNEKQEKITYTPESDKKGYEWLKYILEHDKELCTGD